MSKLKVCWLSAGVSSAIAAYLAKDVDEYIYIDIENQHPDSMRFIKDCEKLYNHEITILKSQYGSVENVIKTFRFISSPYGAKCTEVLKKRMRFKWEFEHREDDIIYVWGMDCNETHRADRIIQTMPNFKHEFPLIDNNMTKANAHGLLEKLGIKRPAMYDLGYNNNNCIGCVKGGMGYWNQIRKDFPEVFNRMAKLEREVGHTCIKGQYLDELNPDRGRMSQEIMPDCGIMCELDS